MPNCSIDSCRAEVDLTQKCCAMRAKTRDASAIISLPISFDGWGLSGRLYETEPGDQVGHSERQHYVRKRSVLRKRILAEA
ncbi:protein of unknown function [Bradyrhizobium vignae]|uniref:Uncharacterized protein n=1 Tax=Bradyrhizobium vignae TaxID=1549949 RepID=A0A2U3Q919_9BRAD|nr:protein of unknown function [Bradyrhizobium vignae]